MLAASCLITSTPDFEDEEQTSPRLVSATARPEIRRLLAIDTTATFTADVVSENDQDEPIFVRLILDYGVPSGRSDYYVDQFNNNEDVAPATTANEARTAKATWRPLSELDRGCHTFTLMVSHRFDSSTGCPEDLADSDEITWVAYVCREGETCPPESIDPETCPKPSVRCPPIPDDVPEESATTGSAQ